MHFSIEESFRGISGTEVVIFTGTGGGDCGTPLPVGMRVLIFAYKEKNGDLWTGMCSGNQVITTSDDPLLVELRKVKNAPAFASVFGHVRFASTDIMRGELTTAGPIRKTKVILQRDENVYAAFTDNNGDYNFSGLPVGSYHIRLDLPPKFAFELPSELADKENPSVDLGNGECREVDLVGTPGGKIRGKLLKPDGTPAQGVTVTLLPFDLSRKVDKYEGYWDITDDDGRFELKALSAGDYMLTVNVTEAPNDEAPFPPTYYPSARSRDGAAAIHVKSGEQLDVDFWLPEILNERIVKVRIVWPDGTPVTSEAFASLDTTEHPGEVEAGSRADSNGVVELKAFGSQKFRVLAEASKGYQKEFCSLPVPVPDGPNPAVTAKLTVSTESCELWRIDHISRARSH